ncbi:O-antigen ligase family protein [Franconibacter pulveris]
MKTLLLLLLCLTLFYIPDSGGSGVALPFNLTFLCWLGLVLIILAWRYRNAELKAPRQPLLLAGGLLLLLPWLLQARGNPGVWVLLAALLLWLALLRLPFTPRHRRAALLAVFVLALGQAGTGLLQAFCPHLAARLYEFDWLRNQGRPYGIFQQVNLLASFLATGAGCGFLLLLTERRARGITAVLITAGLGVLAFVLALNQSRAGAVGAVAVIAALCAVAGRGKAPRAGAALAVMALGAGAGWYITQHVTVLVNGEPFLMARDYAGSTQERRHILHITWQMIMLHPWAGWGYGTFEYAFSRWLLAHPGYTFRVPVTHPHNELLYAWFQGGITALAGMLVLFAGWVRMLIRALKTRRATLAYALLIVPLLAHLNLEYPFYQSFIHFGLFLLLLRLGVAQAPPAARRAARAPRLAAVLCGAALIVFSGAGLYANHQLTALERNQLAGFPSPAPWYFATQSERAQFDEMVALLMDYNRTRNAANLDEFMARAQAWSLRHNDANVWRSMMMIEQFRGNQARAAEMAQTYKKLFPLQNEK